MISKKALGALWILLGSGLFVALFSYSPLDPSWNTAIDAPPHNWLGELGSFSADILIQFFGYISYLIPFLLGAYGLHAFFGPKAWLYSAVAFCCSILLLNGEPLWILLKNGWPLLLGLALIPLVGLLYRKRHLLMPAPKVEKRVFEEPILSATPEKKPRRTPPPQVAPIFPQEKPVDLGTDYHLPPLDLLEAESNQKQKPTVSSEELEERARQLESVLAEFGVKGEITNTHPGPVVTLYELKPAPGIKSSRVISLADDIARSMSALSARVAVVPGRNVIGIELPNPQRETVYLKDLLLHKDYEASSARLALVLGKDISGQPVITDLAKMPHLLVAGTTGSGKSVGVNGMILSLLYRLPPENCKFIMIDPKMLELSIYDGIPHLLSPVVTDPKKAVVALKWTVKEMENRYRQMSKLGVRNIEGFNQKILDYKKRGEAIVRTVQTGFDSETGKPLFEDQALQLTPLPFIVVIVDEMADLMLVAGKDIEAAIQRLAQMARAAGIHLIMATQRPSVDVITGTIKANFPSRISFQVTSKIDSRTILGEQGAEQLLGQGDMLFMGPGGKIARVHGPFVKDSEVEEIVAYLKTQGTPTYIDSITVDEEEGEVTLEGGDDKDDLYKQALDLVMRDKKASTSYIQRHLQIGYNRAARLIDQMEKEGVISAANHVGKREILI